MSCCICFEVVEDTPFYAHPDDQHIFHTDCIFGWLESTTVIDANCPYCTLPMENSKRLVSLCFNSRGFAESFWKSSDPEDLKIALSLRYYSATDKKWRLFSLAEKGLVEPFEVVLSTLKFDALSAKDYDEIAQRAIAEGQIGFLKHMLDKGIVHIYDIFRAFDEAVAQGKTDIVRLLFSYGFTHALGPHLISEIGRQKSSSRIPLTCELEIGNLLLEHGYTFNVFSRGILSRSLFESKRHCVDDLLDRGYDPCFFKCSEVLHAAERHSSFEGVRWCIEVVGCTHRETWKEIKQVSFEENLAELYQYICMKLEDEPTELGSIILYRALQNAAGLEELKRIESLGYELTEYFPKFSGEVVDVDQAEYLVNAGCSFGRVSGQLFIKLAQQGRTDLISKMVDSGMLFDDQLFHDCMWEVRETTTPEFLDILLEHNCIDIESPRFWSCCHRFGVNWGFKAVNYAGWNRLLENYDALRIICIGTEFSPLVRYLVDKGIPANIDGGVLVSNALESDDTDLLRYLLEKDQSISLLTQITFISRTKLFNETVIYFFDHFIKTSNPESYGHVLKRLRDSETAFYLFCKYEDKGWPVSFDEITFIVVKSNSDVLFAKFRNHYAHRGLNMQKLLIMAASLKATFIFSYIIKTNPEQVQFDSHVLRYSQRINTEDNMFHVARIHAMKCESCSDFKKTISMFEPMEIIDMMVARHDKLAS